MRNLHMNENIGFSEFLVSRNLILQLHVCMLSIVEIIQRKITQSNFEFYYIFSCRMTILASREHTCIHPEISKSRNKNEGCKELMDVSTVVLLGHYIQMIKRFLLDYIGGIMISMLD